MFRQMIRLTRLSLFHKVRRFRDFIGVYYKCREKKSIGKSEESRGIYRVQE